MKPYKELRWPRFWPFLRVVDDLPATKRGRRKASNYGVSIVIRRDVLESEPWVLQQEIYECRYWVTHFWRLVDFPLFKLFGSKRAAAHLARVECASRAQEIRAYLHESYAEIGIPIPPAQPLAWAHGYARSIHGAKNYPQFSAAGWTVDDVYNEIVRNL